MTDFQPEEEPNIFSNQKAIVLPPKQSSKRKLTTKRKQQLKTRLIKYTIALVLLLGVSGYGLYKINEWFNYHTFKFQTPIILQSPLIIEPRENVQELPSGSSVIPEAEAKEIDFSGATFISKATGTTDQLSTDKSNITDVVRKVYRLESSSGKNDGCVTKGLGYNGYGYRQNKSEWKCFTSREEVAGYVEWQINKYLKTMDLPTALCYYNSGVKTSNCEYYQNYLKIK